MKKAFREAGDSEWKRYVEINVMDPRLQKSEAFCRVLDDIAPEPPVSSVVQRGLRAVFNALPMIMPRHVHVYGRDGTRAAPELSF